MQQKWGKVAQKVASDMYKATKLSEFCSKPQASPKSTTKTITVTTSVEEQTHILNTFLQSMLHYFSSLIIHTYGSSVAHKKYLLD